MIMTMMMTLLYFTLPSSFINNNNLWLIVRWSLMSCLTICFNSSGVTRKEADRPG